MNDELDTLLIDLEDRQQTFKNDLQTLKDTIEWVRKDIIEIDKLKAEIKLKYGNQE